MAGQLSHCAIVKSERVSAQAGFQLLLSRIQHLACVAPEPVNVQDLQ